MEKLRTQHDKALRDAVIAELRWDPRVDDKEIGVRVEAGVVTLTGVVDGWAKKLSAAEAAHRVGDVLDVANDVVVEVAGEGLHTDAEVARATRSTLEWDIHVPAARIRTTVADGVVTLEGAVERWSEREDAARAVRRLAGVRGVTNNIAVKPKPVDPEDVRRQLREALRRQMSREIDRLEIDVTDGVLTVRGAVRSWHERRAVLGVLKCTPGVRRLEAALAVDPAAALGDAEPTPCVTG